MDVDTSADISGQNGQITENASIAPTNKESSPKTNTFGDEAEMLIKEEESIEIFPVKIEEKPNFNITLKSKVVTNPKIENIKGTVVEETKDFAENILNNDLNEIKLKDCNEQANCDIVQSISTESSSTSDVKQPQPDQPVESINSVVPPIEDISEDNSKKCQETDDDVVMVTDTEDEDEKPKDSESMPALPRNDVEHKVAPSMEPTIPVETNVKQTVENADDDVIMLDTDSQDEVITKKPSYNENTKTVDSATSELQTPDTAIAELMFEKPAEPLKLLENLVDKSYPVENLPEKPTEKVEVPINKKKPEPKKRPSTINEVRECVNFECTSKNKSDFIKSPGFVLNFYNVPKKLSRIQYVCSECFDESLTSYKALCGALLDQQPLLLQDLPKRADLVEILDSSEEEDNTQTSIDDDTEVLSKDILTTLDENFDEILAKTLEKVNIDQQMEWTRTIINHKIKQNEEMSNEIAMEFKSLQKMADTMYTKLYRNANYVIEELPPYDLNTNKQLQLAGPSYPPFGEIVYSPVDTTSLYYAVRQKLLAAWIPCKITEPMETVFQGTMQKCYKVKFLRSKGLLMKCVPETHIAYGTPPSVRLQVAVRVIALFQMDSVMGSKDNLRASFFPGIIAEPLQAYNRWRYLIFFDDGYAQYVSPDNVRLVCGVSKNVWEDVHPDSSHFIENYLKQYKTQRPMVQLRKGQRMITEWNGKWLYAKVHEIDSSLVQMYFEEGKRTEWIYRGSTRLGPLFREKQSQKHSAGLTKRNEPYVEYMSIVDDDGKSKAIFSKSPSSAAPPLAPISSRSTSPVVTTPAEQTDQNPQQQEEKRAVAKKSVSAATRPPQVQHMNNSTIYVEEDNRPKGKVVYYTAKKHMPPRKYTSHDCGVGCLYDVKHNLSSYSPLAKPLLSGWERQICKSKTKKVVMYRTPCGRRIRNMSELHQYLRLTNCPLNVENFDFDFLIHCLAEYVIDSCIMQKHDLSDGAENMVVPCVNYYDTTMPPPCIYSAKRIPTEGVNLNLDKNFMCGCDCEDDCLDKLKCQCWQLTLAGAKFGNSNTPPEQVGYEFKRLPEPVPTGIYECNSRCKCSRTCLNRVAQQPLQMKLQVFKTGNRGWGLRCLNDVPKGSFICIYAGDLLTEQNANEAGDNYGDEYFAELDYIEVVENLKEGYEPDVVNDDDFDDDEYDPDIEKQRRDDDTDDDEFVAKTSFTNVKTRYNTRHSVDASKSKHEIEKKDIKQIKRDAEILNSENYNTKKNEENGDPAEIVISDEDEERQPISFVPNTSVMAFDKDNAANKYKSIRKFYGKHEYCYIMDAKKTGNIGRYFNHSCSPNLFVQNVFVDTHDLRFPWVAFFALSHIRAGTELTWNYNYDVGSVPGKVLYCQCGTETCRGRLL